MKNWLFIVFLSWISTTYAGLFEDDLLPADQAFAFDATITDQNRVRAVWNLADGYYLYKNKIRFATETPGIQLGEAQFPEGKIKEDEFFGKVEIYRKQVLIDIPVTREPGAASTFELKASSQGCADRGVCYPPQTQTASLTLKDAQTPGGRSSGDALKALSELGIGFGAEDELLSADEAFQSSVDVTDANTLTARWIIAEGYYLYRHRFEFALTPEDVATLSPAELPEGEHKTDEFFGDIQVYHQEVVATIPLQRSSFAKTPVTLTLKYQGCAERGVCYPPITKQVKLTLPAVSPGGAATEDIKSAQTNVPSQPLSDADRFTRMLTEGSLLTVILAALGFGLLLAFTACMYPMIPILSSIIVGQGEKTTVARSFFLSFVYVEALAITFAVIGGIVASFSGAVGIQALFQKPIFLIPFALLFVLLALAMFGFFNIQLPAGLQGRLSAISNRQRGGTLVGVFIMGSLSALIVGPCGGPILIAALSYAASAGPVKGAIAMFALGNGMGLPLLLVGASGGKLLPKAGDWMNVVKAVAGVILLGVAIMFLSRMPHMFSPMLIMLLWATLLIVSGIYLGATEPLPVDSTGWRKLWKGLGLVMLLYGVVVMLGGLSGARDATNPLHGSRLFASVTPSVGVASEGVSGGHRPALHFKRIKTVADLDQAIAVARAEGKPVMLDFYADWCTYCTQYEEYVFPAPEVQEALADYVLLQADVTATDAEDKALMKKVGVVLPPAILFFDKTTGNEIRPYRVVGAMQAAAFAAHVKKAGQ